MGRPTTRVCQAAFSERCGAEFMRPTSTRGSIEAWKLDERWPINAVRLLGDRHTNRKSRCLEQSNLHPSIFPHSCRWMARWRNNLQRVISRLGDGQHDQLRPSNRSTLQLWCSLPLPPVHRSLSLRPPPVPHRPSARSHADPLTQEQHTDSPMGASPAMSMGLLEGFRVQSCCMRTPPLNPSLQGYLAIFVLTLPTDPARAAKSLPCSSTGHHANRLSPFFKCRQPQADSSRRPGTPWTSTCYVGLCMHNGSTPYRVRFLLKQSSINDQLALVER